MKEIIGYRGPDFLGYKYITLCQGGIKLESLPIKLCQEPLDAWLEFGNQLKEFLGQYDKKNSTLIWRSKPTFKDSDNGCYVIARLVVYPKNIFNILKEKEFYFTKSGDPKFNNGHCLVSNINELSEEKWKYLLLEEIPN